MFALSRILLVFFSVLSALLVFLFPGLLLFLLVVALCLPSFSLRVHCPGMLFASFCGPSSLVLTTPSLLPLPLIGLFLLHLLTCLLLFAQCSWACCFLGLFSYRSVFFSLHCGCLVFFLGVLSLSTCGMFSSPLLVVLVGVLGWLQVMSCHWL